MVVFGYILGQIPLTLAVGYYISKSGRSANVIDELLVTMDFESIGMSDNLVFFLLLLMFVVAIGALYIGVTRLHKRPFRSILTGRRSVDWSRIFWGFGLWFGMSLVAEVITYILWPENYTFQFELSSFAILLILVILLLPIQTTFEELFIRGYLMQSIGLLFNPRWVPLILTSMIFGIMHVMNPEVAEFGLGTMMIYYIGIALFLGIITLLDDGLELAIGIHAATNMYGALFVNFEDSAIKTPSLFQLSVVDAQAMTTIAFVSAIVFFFIIRKKFGPWNWAFIFASVKLDGSSDYLDWLNVKKLGYLSHGLPGNRLEKPVSLDGLEEGIEFYHVAGKGTLLLTNQYSPFKKNGPVQKRFQLGYYELLLASTYQFETTEEDDHHPDYQTKIGRDLRVLKAIARTSYERQFLSYKPYKMGLEDGEMIYFILQPFPDSSTHNIDGWQFGRQLVTEVSARQYEIGKTNGGLVLIQEIRSLEDFPFISVPQSAL